MVPLHVPPRRGYGAATPTGQHRSGDLRRFLASPRLAGWPEVHLARLLHRLHHFLGGQERCGAEIPVPAGAGDGDRHRGGVDIVRDFAQPDKVEFIPFSFWYDAPLTSPYSDRG